MHLENAYRAAQPLVLSDVAIAATMVGQWHEIAMAYALSSVILVNVWLILSFYLIAARFTRNNASVRGSLGWNQGIPIMVAMVSIRMGGTIVP